MKQKGFALVYLLIGVLVLSAVGGGVYYFGKSQVKTDPSSLNTSSVTQPTSVPSTDETVNPDSIGANWETYTNPELGYSFKYPTNFWITSVSTTKPGVASMGDAPSAPENTVAFLSIRQNSIDEKFNIDAGMADHLRIYSEYKVLGQKNIQVANFPARYVEATVNNEDSIILVLLQKNNSYTVLLEAVANDNKITNSQLKSIFDQILSTFRFD